MKIKAILIYGVYFISACLVFAVVLFPKEEAATIVSQRLVRALPVKQVRVPAVDFAFPFGISLAGASFELDGGRMIVPSSIKLSVRPDTFFRKIKRTGVTVVFGSGVVNGTLDSFRIMESPFSRISIQVQGLELKNILYKNDLANIALDFTVDGGFDYPDASGSVGGTSEKGTGRLVFTTVSARVDHSVFRKMGIDTLDFTEVEIRFSLDDKTLVIEKLLAKGPVMTLKLSGDIKPEDRFSNSLFENSYVQLKGYLQPSAAYLPKFANVSSLVKLFKDVHEKGIPFQVNGLVKYPGVTL